VAYLCVGLAIWMSYHTWRGTVPYVWNPGEKNEPGQPMRRGQRFLFGVGSLLFAALGWLFLHPFLK
jgi:hypothetical protein